MADQKEVEPDPYTSRDHAEGLEVLAKLKAQAVDFVHKKCPTCGYEQEMKHQEFCADCIEKSGIKTVLI